MSLNENPDSSPVVDGSHHFVEAVRCALRQTEPDATALSFLDQDQKIPRYLIGRNEEATALQGLIAVNGIIDDFCEETSNELGTPIIKSCNLPADAWVVNCSTSISPVKVNDRLSALKLKHLLGINKVIQASAGALNWPWFVCQQRLSVENDLAQWVDLYDLLADDESRKTLLDVVCFRLTGDVAYMKNYLVRIQEQYFEEFMNYSGEVFVDAGGFDGDTTEAFCQRYPDYQRVYLFEPSAANMQAAQQRLKLYSEIEFRQMALSDKEEWLNFNSALGSASAVTDVASGQVRACRLDNVVEGSVSFIKMDLEGWEMKALDGARNLIQKSRSKLAISVYHSASDFLDVPKLVLKLNPDRQVYLRHYTQGWSETIMYFK